jgi:hypothetical protein
MSKKPALVVCLSVCLIAAMSAAGIVWAKQNRATVKTIKLGTPAWRIRLAKNFEFDQNGHFGSQTQYLCKDADANHGKFCVQCKNGKVTAIFVKFDPPLSRAKSIEEVQHLVGTNEWIENDCSEMHSGDGEMKTNPNCGKQEETAFHSPPSEYFYFKQGIAAELQFVSIADDRVTDLMIWG